MPHVRRVARASVIPPHARPSTAKLGGCSASCSASPSQLPSPHTHPQPVGIYSPPEDSLHRIAAVGTYSLISRGWNRGKLLVFSFCCFWSAPPARPAWRSESAALRHRPAPRPPRTSPSARCWGAAARLARHGGAVAGRPPGRPPGRAAADVLGTSLPSCAPLLGPRPCRWLDGCCAVWQAKLSERNVVELVNKLQELGLLGDDLLHSTNGRAYLTADHLRKEVLDTVRDAGGRIPVVQPPVPSPAVFARQLSTASSYS